MDRYLEKTLMWFVWLLPHDVIRWAIFRAWANATTGKWSNVTPDSVTLSELIDRWEQGNK